jgi:hypothetical protein
MQLNIKNPNTKIPMYEKKSNTTSIIIAIIAIFLILGGVYLINQSFNKSKSTSSTSDNSNNTTATTTPAATDTSSTSTPTTSDTSSSTSSDTSNTTANNATDGSTSTTTTDPSSTTSSSTSGTDSTSGSTTTSTDPSSTTSSTTTSTTPSTLKDDEAIVQVTNVTPNSDGSNRYDITIVDTGFQNGTKLKKGATTYINVSGVTMVAGKTYDISSITEQDGKISISNLTATEVTS